jgi:hypothetical protein
MEDDQQRWQHEQGSEPEWVRDMLNVPWVTEIAKDGSIKILDADGLTVAILAGRNAEMMALTASVICDQCNKI